MDLQSKFGSGFGHCNHDDGSRRFANSRLAALAATDGTDHRSDNAGHPQHMFALGQIEVVGFTVRITQSYNLWIAIVGEGIPQAP